MIVVSNDDYNRRSKDVIVVAMTSNPAPAPFAFPITSADLAVGALNRPGKVRADKIYALAKSIVVKEFGKVSPPVLAKIAELLTEILARK